MTELPAPRPSGPLLRLCDPKWWPDLDEMDKHYPGPTHMTLALGCTPGIDPDPDCPNCLPTVCVRCRHHPTLPCGCGCQCPHWGVCQCEEDEGETDDD